MLRRLAFIINVGWMLFFIFMILKEGAPEDISTVFLIFLMGFVMPMINIIALSDKGKSNSKSLLGLYFERKSLEERQKIEKLKMTSEGKF